MKITIIAIGKIREPWIADGIAEYSKRLRNYASVEVLEIQGEKVSRKASPKEIQIAVETEGQRILSRWQNSYWGIACDSNGKAIASEGLAQLFSEEISQFGKHPVFVLGGSWGLSPSVLLRCQHVISFGPNTFPHQLFRVMLFEQIYRAFKIISGETYHK